MPLPPRQKLSRMLMVHIWWCYIIQFTLPLSYYSCIIAWQQIKTYYVYRIWSWMISNWVRVFILASNWNLWTASPVGPWLTANNTTANTDHYRVVTLYGIRYVIISSLFNIYLRTLSLNPNIGKWHVIINQILCTCTQNINLTDQVGHSWYLKIVRQLITQNHIV